MLGETERIDNSSSHHQDFLNQVEENTGILLGIYNDFTVSPEVFNNQQAQAKLGELATDSKAVLGHIKTHVKAPFDLVGSVITDAVKPEEKPALTRVCVPAGLAIELATITKLTSFFNLPLAIHIAGDDPSPKKILTASLAMGAITPAWVAISSYATGFGMKYGHRSRRAVERTALPRALKAVSDKNDISEPLIYDKDKNWLQNTVRLGGLSLKKGLSSFYVVTPKVYSAVFEGADDKEIIRLNNQIAKWAALGAFTVAATATSAVGVLHDIAPGLASVAANELGSPYNFMALQFGWAGLKTLYSKTKAKAKAFRSITKPSLKEPQILLPVPTQLLNSETM